MTREPVYGTSLTLLTDLYQLTMAYGYWKSGLAERESVFHLFYRRNPFAGGFSLVAGLGTALDHLSAFRFCSSDLEYLATLKGGDGQPLFEGGFLDYLRQFELRVDVDAMPEGTVAFPHEPIVRVKGPLLQCQLLETPLLNIVNFQTLIATKAARVCHAARREPVLEFGLRRAQGVDGGLSAARAAFVGGVAATSNVLAGKLYGIPVRGTHAHSWVMCFDTELESFEAYARAMPNNCVFLVDTYSTLDGVRHAIQVGRKLREEGHEMVGVRLDSGDLAHLSIEARRMLDDAGFPKVAIVASNQLDEYVIESLKQQGATIGVWGVGTNLVTAYDEPALGGVYKLAAVRTDQGAWQHTLKLSEQPIKVSTPGVQQVRRYYAGDHMVADTLYDLTGTNSLESEHFPPEDLTLALPLPEYSRSEDLLVPVIREGAQVYAPPSLVESRERGLAQLEALGSRTRRILHPQSYPVGLHPGLRDLKVELVRARRAALSRPGSTRQGAA